MAVQAHLEAIPGLEVLATLYTILPFQVLEGNLYCLCQLLGTLDRLWFVTPLTPISVSLFVWPFSSAFLLFLRKTPIGFKLTWRSPQLPLQILPYFFEGVTV